MNIINILRKKWKINQCYQQKKEKYHLEKTKEVYKMKLKVIGNCDGCHKEKEIINVGNNLIFCENCMKNINKKLWHNPINEIFIQNVL